MTTTQHALAATLPDRDRPGVCPECHDWSGEIGVAGRGAWRYCTDHRVRWFLHDPADDGERWDRLTARSRFAAWRADDAEIELDLLGIDSSISIDDYTVVKPRYSSEHFPFGLDTACDGYCPECEGAITIGFNAGVSLLWRDFDCGSRTMWRCVRFESEAERDAFRRLHDAADVDEAIRLIYAAKPGLGREAALREARASDVWAAEPLPETEVGAA